MTRFFTPLSCPFAGIAGGIWLLAPAILLAQEPHRSDGTGRPLFQPLAPGGDSAWIRDVNAMSERERVRRIGNYRPVKVKESGANPPATSPVEGQPRPDASIAPPPPEARLHPVTTSTGQSLRPAARSRSTSPRIRVGPQPTPSSHQIRVATRGSHSTGTQAARTRLQREMAFMPTRNRADYPYAPYRSKAEYEAALAQASWKPAKTASNPKKFRFPNLFKRSASPKEEEPRRSGKTKSRKPSKNPVRSKASSKGASALPQADSRRGPVIQTTLFGS